MNPITTILAMAVGVAICAMFGHSDNALEKSMNTQQVLYETRRFDL